MLLNNFFEALARLKGLEGKGSFKKKISAFGELVAAEPLILRYVDDRERKSLGVNTATFNKAKLLGTTSKPLTIGETLSLHDTLRLTSGKDSTLKRIEILSKIIGGCDTQNLHFLEAYYTSGRFRTGIGCRSYRALARPDSKSNSLKPMLASTVSPKSHLEYSIQAKLDGVRLVMKKKGSKLLFTSRNGLPFPPAFYESLRSISDELSRAPFDFILDGELWKGGAHPGQGFQQLSRVFRAKKRVNLEGTCLYLFDLLMINGKDLSSEPYLTRRLQLESRFKFISKDSIRIIPRLATLSGINCQHKVLDSYLRAHPDWEGLLLKSTNSHYEWDKRSTNWIKYKTLGQTLDLQITAVFSGVGKYMGGPGAYELSVLVNGKLSPIGRLGTGFTQDERSELAALFAKGSPLIVEVQAQALTKSPRYACGYSVRFPSFKRIRPDRASPLTIEEVKAIFYKSTR